MGFMDLLVIGLLGGATLRIAPIGLGPRDRRIARPVLE